MLIRNALAVIFICYDRIFVECLFNWQASCIVKGFFKIFALTEINGFLDRNNPAVFSNSPENEWGTPAFPESD